MACFLPPELVICIVENFDCATDIFSLARVNRRLLDTLLPCLYKFNVRKQDSSALHWLAQNGVSRVTELLLQQYEADINAIHEHETPLSRAAIHGSESVTEILLRRPDISVNSRNNRGQTALWYAAKEGHAAIVVQLLAKANLETDWPDDEYGHTPLAAAICQGHEQIVKILTFSERVDINARDLNNRTPISLAVSSANEEIAKMLLQEGADVNVADNKRELPLDKAVAREDLAMTKILLEAENKSSSVSEFERGHRTTKALLTAAERGYTEIARLLINNKFGVNVTDHYGRAPLHLAAMNGHSCVVTELLSCKDIDVNLRDRYGATALHAASTHGYLDIFNQLLARPDIDVDVQDQNGATPFLLAVKHGQQTLALRLLSLPDVDVNVVAQSPFRDDGSTALHYAVKGQSIAITQSLLRRSELCLNVIDKDGLTPLTWAIDKGGINIVDLLLTRMDTRINTDSLDEVPALWLAVSNTDFRMVQRLLLRPDVDINRGCYMYCAPLPRAIQKGTIEIVKLLLAQGKRLDINKRYIEGETVLVQAVRKGSLSIVDLILQDTRVDPHIPDNEGRTALWWARSERHAAIAERLLADNRIEAGIHTIGSKLDAEETAVNNKS